MTSDTTATDAGQRQGVAGLVALITLASGLSALMVYGLGVLGPFLTSEFGLSRAQLGLLPTLLWVVAGGAAPLLGPLVDMYGGRRVLSGYFTMHAVAFVALAVAPSFLWVAAATMAGGLVLAVSNPVTNQLVAKHVTPKLVGRVLGTKQAGQSAMAMFVGAAMPLGAAHFGWRVVVLAFAGLGPIGLIATRRIVPPPEAPSDDLSRITINAWLTSVRGRSHVTSPDFRWLLVFSVFMSAGLAVVLVYLPLYGHEQLGMTEASAGLLIVIIGGVGMFGRLAWGWAADKAATAAIPLGVLALGAAGAIAAFILAESFGFAIALVGAATFGATAGSWAVVAAVSVVRAVDGAALGWASGVLQTSVLFGVMISPVLFGASVDVSGSYVYGWLGAIGMFLMAAGVAAWWWRSQRTTTRDTRS